MLIGELARRANLGIDTLRYYLKRRLIEPKLLRASGYQEFDETAVMRLKFIGRAKQLGFSLKEIRELIDLQEHPDTTCRTVGQKARTKLAMVNDKIALLETMRDDLEKLVAACPDDDRGLDHCPIINQLLRREKA